MKISLIVIRCQDIEKSKIFYESLGLVFQKEKHKNGPVHYSTKYEDIVFELYPNKNLAPNDNIRLGFKLTKLYETLKKLEIKTSYKFDNKTIYVVEDPDGRKVELS